jgi:hypothetical protein
LKRPLVRHTEEPYDDQEHNCASHRASDQEGSRIALFR